MQNRATTLPVTEAVHGDQVKGGPAPLESSCKARAGPGQPPVLGTPGRQPNAFSFLLLISGSTRPKAPPRPPLPAAGPRQRHPRSGSGASRTPTRPGRPQPHAAWSSAQSPAERKWADTCRPLSSTQAPTQSLDCAPRDAAPLLSRSLSTQQQDVCILKGARPTQKASTGLTPAARSSFLRLPLGRDT